MAAELDGPRLEPSAGGAPRQLVVFLHGYGADGNDLIDIGHAWKGLLPHAAFVSPHAPDPCGQMPTGRQWFPLASRNVNERWRGVSQAAPVLQSFLDTELARHNLPASALALVGFSQGTMMGLHVGLRRAVAPFAIVGYSGVLVMPQDVEPDAFAGEVDRGRLFSWSMAIAMTSFRCRPCSKVQRVLPRSQYRPNGTFSAGIGHGIDQDGLRHGGEFLNRAISRQTMHLRRATAGE